MLVSQEIADLGLLPLGVDVDGLDIGQLHVLHFVFLSFGVQDLGRIRPVEFGHAVDFLGGRLDLGLGQLLVWKQAVQELVSSRDTFHRLGLLALHRHVFLCLCLKNQLTLFQGRSVALALALLLWLLDEPEFLQLCLQLGIFLLLVWEPWHDDVEDVLSRLKFSRLQGRIVEQRLLVQIELSTRPDQALLLDSA